MNIIIIDGYVNFLKDHGKFKTFSLSNKLNNKKIYIDCLVNYDPEIKDNDYVIIQGQIEQSQWEGENGEKRKKHYIRVNYIKKLIKNKSNEAVKKVVETFDGDEIAF